MRWVWHKGGGAISEVGVARGGGGTVTPSFGR